MTAVKKDIYIEQGATFILHFQWCEQGPIVNGEATVGDPYDLTGWKARMQARKDQQSPAIIDATTENGKIVLGAIPGDWDATPDLTNGRIELRLTDEDTDLLSLKTAKYDLEVEDPEGRVFRMLQGVITVDPNITQEPDDPIVGA